MIERGWSLVDLTREIPYAGQGVCFSHCTCPHVITIMLIRQIGKILAAPSLSTFNMK